MKYATVLEQQLLRASQYMHRICLLSVHIGLRSPTAASHPAPLQWTKDWWKCMCLMKALVHGHTQQTDMVLFLFPDPSEEGSGDEANMVCVLWCTGESYQLAKWGHSAFHTMSHLSCLGSYSAHITVSHSQTLATVRVWLRETPHIKLSVAPAGQPCCLWIHSLNFYITCKKSKQKSWI